MTVLKGFDTDMPLYDLIDAVKKKARYTYIYRGVSQVLDHMLIIPSLMNAVDGVKVVHFNVDFPEPLYGDDPKVGIRSSDHDVVMAFFDLDNDDNSHQPHKSKNASMTS